MAAQHDNPPTHPTLSRREMLTATAVTLGGAAVASTARAQEPRPSEPNAKVAIVTGSSRGIGAATARRLAQDGLAVTVNYLVNDELAAGVVREIEAAGGRAISVQADVSDAAAVRKLFDATERAFGGVDVVVNNAGIMSLAPIAEMNDELFDRQVDVNFKGAFHVMREAARRVRRGGRIVSLSSSITQLLTATYGPYAGTKAAISAMTGCLAKELRGRDISVTAIAPGVVDTTLFTDGKTPEQIATFVQRTPHGRLGEPIDIASMISSLCGPDGYWTNGTTVYVHGGLL